MSNALPEPVHPWVPPNTFGARLALIRNFRKWNAKEAALACGVPEASWREWELFGRRPHGYQDICQRIADNSGCDLVWLMLGRTNPYPDAGRGGDQVSEMSSVQSREGAPLRPALRLVVTE